MIDRGYWKAYSASMAMIFGALLLLLQLLDYVFPKPQTDLEQLIDDRPGLEGETGKFLWEDHEGHRAWGVSFPGPPGAQTVVVYWDINSWEPEETLLFDHVSIYGSIGDLLTAAGGELTWETWEGGE